MKIINILFFLSILLFPLLLSSKADSTNDWYSFSIPFQMDFDSPVNIGKFVLDSPAGKHGFCKIKDGHFYFEDGIRAKFWGTNLVFNACFPNKNQAILLANRIAFFGFNAVRLHHMDFAFEPFGIFKDTSPAYNDPQMKKTGELSKIQLDRLDYLIYQLKQHGIYIDMNLLVSRHFTESDGIKDANQLEMAAKPVSMFDPKLIELQEQYAKNLLTHYNTYTKLRYCDDPAIALVEITNENTLAGGYFNKNIPEYYLHELNLQWKKWKTINDGNQQNFYYDVEKKYFTEMVNFLKKDLNIKIPITGSQYSNVKVQESCDFIDKHAYWDPPTFPHKAWDLNDFRITNQSLLLDQNLGIIGSLESTDPKHSLQGPYQKPYTITEWNHGYPNQYAYETPVILAAKANLNNWDGLFQFAFSHDWKSGPKIDDIHSQLDAIANSQKLILCSLASKLYLNGQKIVIEINDGLFKLNSSVVAGIINSTNQKANPYIIGPFKIQLNNNGAVFIYPIDKKTLKNSSKFIIVVIGEIKNTKSGWKNDIFNWGNSPVLLKKMDVGITWLNEKNFNVYEINSNGKRGKQFIIKDENFQQLIQILLGLNLLKMKRDLKIITNNLTPSIIYRLNILLGSTNILHSHSK